MVRADVGFILMFLDSKMTSNESETHYVCKMKLKTFSLHLNLKTNVMRKFYFTIITLVALLCVTVSASATPFKAVYLELTVNETGRGKVYMKQRTRTIRRHGRARTLFSNA